MLWYNINLCRESCAPETVSGLVPSYASTLPAETFIRRVDTIGTLLVREFHEFDVFDAFAKSQMLVELAPSITSS